MPLGIYDGDDIFDYQSSQNYYEIEYLIDLFEIRQYAKAKKDDIHKTKRFSCPKSKRILKSQPTSIKIKHKKPSITEQKSSENSDHKKKSKIFDYDEQLQLESADTQGESTVKNRHPEDFSTFRRHFYCTYQQQIKSSFEKQYNIEIINIRPAHIDESVQNDFIKRWQVHSSYYPSLVYHGTKLSNIGSILRYGFLIPDQPHPRNKNAPLIKTQNGNAYGTGIYCSQTATYSLTYLKTTNTLLVCAAIPKHNTCGKIERSHGNILVLSHVSDIIPLFLLDFRYMDKSGINYPWFIQEHRLKVIEKEEINESLIISKKSLRKLANFTADEVQMFKLLVKLKFQS